MDPQANLQEQERLIKERRNLTAFDDLFGPKHCAIRADLRELRQTLKTWISNGGFQPDWTKAPNARKYYGR